MPPSMKTTSTNKTPLGKRKGVELAPQPVRLKRSRQDKLRAKKSNRPTNGWSSEESEEEEEEADEQDEAEGSASGSGSEGESADEEAARARMLAALEAHQAAFLQDAAPTLVAKARQDKGKAIAVKPIWEMDMDDFEDEEDDDSEEEDDDEDDDAFAPSASGNQPTVIAFAEPTASAAGALGSHRDMRNFMNPRAKDALKKESIADLANAKHRNKARTAAPSAQLDAAQEAHLSSLDASLATLIRPLAATNQSTASALPELLRALPTAPTKLHKGLAPLPSNAPRTLRKGQSAVNLERARKRDAAAGVLPGAKVGREALSLKEKRKQEGDDERQRGQGGAVGKMTRGGLVLSKDEIRMGMGGGGGGGGGKKSGGSRKDGHGGLAAMRAKMSGGKGGKGGKKRR